MYIGVLVLVFCQAAMDLLVCSAMDPIVAIQSGFECENGYNERLWILLPYRAAVDLIVAIQSGYGCVNGHTKRLWI